MLWWLLRDRFFFLAYKIYHSLQAKLNASSVPFMVLGCMMDFFQHVRELIFCSNVRMGTQTGFWTFAGVGTRTQYTLSKSFWLTNMAIKGQISFSCLPCWEHRTFLQIFIFLQILFSRSGDWNLVCSVKIILFNQHGCQGTDVLLTLLRDAAAFSLRSISSSSKINCWLCRCRSISFSKAILAAFTLASALQASSKPNDTFLIHSADPQWSLF